MNGSGCGTPRERSPGSPWPPADRGWLVGRTAGAVPVPVTDEYERLAAAGYEYGPAFRGLRAAWRRDGDVFAEVALPDGTDGTGYGIHPALLDAALHAMALRDGGPEPGGMLVPFSWSGIALHARGAGMLRVKISGEPSGGVSVTCADPAGELVLTVGSLGLRSLDLAAADGADRGSGTLLGLEWDSAPEAVSGTSSGGTHPPDPPRRPAGRCWVISGPARWAGCPVIAMWRGWRRRWRRVWPCRRWWSPP